MFLTTSITKSKQQFLSGAQNPLQSIEDSIKKIKKYLSIHLAIGKETHSLHEWLGNKTDQEINCNQLHAGFQAAALGSYLGDQLFFLEHLNQLLGHLETYLKHSRTMKELANVSELKETYKESTAFANNALHEATNDLAIIWENCFVKTGFFKLNFANSSIIDSSFLSQHEVSELSKKKISELTTEIETLQMFTQKSRQNKTLMMLGENQEKLPMNATLAKKAEALVAEASEIFACVLGEVVGEEGIKQASRGEKFLQKAMKKWPTKEEPRNWTQKEAQLGSEIKRISKLVMQWDAKSDDTHSSEAVASPRLLSPRMLSPRLLSPRRQCKSLPGSILFYAELLNSSEPPYTAQEMEAFRKLQYEIMNLKGKEWEPLKKEIGCQESQEEKQSSLLFK